MKRAIIFPGQGAKIGWNNAGIGTCSKQLKVISQEIDLIDAIKSTNIKFNATAGLSLGAYAALYYSGTFNNKDDLLFLIMQRGTIMENYKNHDCDMTTVIGLEQKVVEDTCREIELGTSQLIRIANFLAPKHFVIGGNLVALREAEVQLKNLGGMIVILDCCDAFHTSLMSEANFNFNKVLNKQSFNKLQIPYISNVTGKFVSNEVELKDLLMDHMQKPVQWEKSIRTMLNEGITEFVEVGPGHALSSIVKEIDPNVKTTVINTIEDIKKLEV